MVIFPPEPPAPGAIRLSEPVVRPPHVYVLTGFRASLVPAGSPAGGSTFAVSVERRKATASSTVSIERYRVTGTGSATRRPAISWTPTRRRRNTTAPACRPKTVAGSDQPTAVRRGVP